MGGEGQDDDAEVAMLMTYIGAVIGALLVVAVIGQGIHRHRLKRGTNDPVAAHIYAIWVALALYGAGAREDYDFLSALIYVAVGLALAWFSGRNVKPQLPPK